MASKDDSQVLSQAVELYSQAVNETPPNRTKLDNLADLLREKPHLLYDGFFDKGYEAASVVIDVCHGGQGVQEDDNLSILTPPAAWGWAAMEETACQVPPQVLFETKYPDFIRRFLELADKTLRNSDSTPAQIVRRAVQALTRFWPELLRLCLNEDPASPTWSKFYTEMTRLGVLVDNLTKFSDDPALQVHLVKYQEVTVVMYTEIPDAAANTRSQVHLGLIPDTHPYINKANAIRRAALAKQQLVQLLPNSDNLRLCNMSFITALINSMVYLMNLRPQLCSDFLDKLTEWYAIINSSEQAMTHAQLVMIGKTLRISLLQLYTRPHMGEYSEVLENTLDNIGGPEWARWQERQARERKRIEWERARERSQATSQQQMPQLPNRHSARWVPAHEGGEDDEEGMADQPAPGAGGEGLGIPPPPPLPDSADARLEVLNRSRASAGKGPQRPGGSSGQRRRPREEDENEDEEKQSRMLEENAKRVRLDEVSSLGAEFSTGSATEAAIQAAKLAAGTETDKELEEQLKQTLPESAFVLEPMEDLKPETRDALFSAALTRVVSASSVVSKFIARNRLQALAPSASSGLPFLTAASLAAQAKARVTESGTAATLPNGVSTNAGILEDSMLALVRLLCNCFIIAKSAADCGDKGGITTELSSKRNELHRFFETIVELITEAPREHYDLGIMLLYELWMAVAITYPEFDGVPAQQSPADGSMDNIGSSVLAMYLHWCDRIFDSVVKSGIGVTLSQKPAPVAAEATSDAIVPANASTTAAQPPPPPQQQQQPDRLILNFVLDAPYISPAAINKLTECLKHTGTATLGIATLEKAMELRPPVLKAGMELLLTYSAHPERTTRIGCIRAVKKYYTTSNFTPLIEKFARKRLENGIAFAKTKLEGQNEMVEKVMQQPDELPEDTGDKQQLDAAVEKAIEKKKAQVVELHQNGEREIEEYLVVQAELLLALCTRNMELYMDVLSAYAKAPPSLQAVIRRIITPLVKSAINAPANLASVLSKFPSGAETLVLRTLFILTSDNARTPAKELVQAMVEICSARGLDARFIVFVANGLDKEEAVKHIGSVLMLMRGPQAQPRLIFEYFSRLTKSYVGHPSVLSPTELLMALHKLASDENAPMLELVGGLHICVEMRNADGTFVFPTPVFNTVLKILPEDPVVSPLMLHTALALHRKRGGPAGMVVTLLHSFIERKVWEMSAAVFDAFVFCFHAMQPGSLGLIKHIPSDALKMMTTGRPALELIVREYVSKMNESYRAKFSWIISDAQEAPQQ
ncbi:hypothetical protein H4R26_000988 [Coemansia thaxteri]|uniref:Uncharacterized protein n=1 Tax=Coemansia thaxteri TaxID=2663907 RepID=A0A9W8EKW8_9FUNG|nr:hypothetical protein H4R26_000988 [Coemansia thaxteri]